jgi:hypothetical protein
VELNLDLCQFRHFRVIFGIVDLLLELLSSLGYSVEIVELLLSLDLLLTLRLNLSFWSRF